MTQTETAVGHGRTVALGLAAFVLLALAGLADMVVHRSH